MVCIHIKQSKTDPFQQGVHIYLGKAHQQICPVHAIVSYLAIWGYHPGPVFTFSDGRMLTREIFGSELDHILCKLNLKDTTTTCTLTALGLVLQHLPNKLAYQMYIKTLGRWQSDAYQCIIIRTPPQQLANLSKMLMPNTIDYTK